MTRLKKLEIIILKEKEGIALVNKYDGEFPKKYFQEFLKYIDLDEDEFFDIVDKFRSPHLWKKVNGTWELRHKVK